MKRFTLLPDGTKVWPKYPQWKHTPGMPKPNRSRLNRGKMRVKYNPLYAADVKASFAALFKVDIGKLPSEPPPDPFKRILDL